MTNPFFSMFGPSPLRPLQEHMSAVYECTQKLIPFFEAVSRRDWTQAEKIQLDIAASERKADDIKKDLRVHMPKGMLLPVHRTDLLNILNVQDGVANRAEDISELIVGRAMVFPQPLDDHMWRLLRRSIDATAQANQAIHELDELLETGFRGREVDIVQNMILELHKIEHETDEIQAAARRQLFKMEKDLPPVDVIFYYKIIDLIGDLADRSDLVGGTLLLFIAR